MATSRDPEAGRESGSWPPADLPAVPAWHTPPHHPAPDAQVTHVWRSSLDVPPEVARDMAHALSADERARAAAIVVDRARERFVAGRFLLRTLLGRYLDLPASQVALAYGPRGKPELAPGLTAARLTFSLAHSRDCIVLALALERAVGVDIEFLRPPSDMAGLVRRAFSAAEQSEWSALPPDRRLEAFYRGWTAKEAWLKARSTGLTWPLDWFTVSLAPGSPLRLLAVDGEPAAPQHWSLLSFEPALGCIGALAVEGAPGPVDFFDHPLPAVAGAAAES